MGTFQISKGLKAITLVGSFLFIIFALAVWGRFAAPGELSTITMPSPVPGTESEVNAHIPAMDFVVGASETLHVVWRSVQNNSDQPWLNSDKLFYTRGDAGGTTWTRPILVADNSLGDNLTRVLVGPDGLHIVFGRNLRHFVSNDNGQSWRELTPLITTDESRASVFDATFADGQLIIAYLDHPEPPYERQRSNTSGNQRLYIVRWSPTKSAVSIEIASFPKSMFGPPVPRLITEGAHLHLVFGLNNERPRGEKRGTIKGTLFYVGSADNGTTWSSPLAATFSVSQDTANTASKGDLQSIEGIELLAVRGRLYAFCRAGSLFVISTSDHLNWSKAVEIAPAKQSPPTAADRSISASTVSDGDRGWIAFVDNRFRRSDRRWWNPLGGFPWSDNPDWVNNDVFASPLSRILDSETNDTQRQRSRDPSRLTESLSYANTVRINASSKQFFVLWSGRRKVGKQLESFSEKPQLFFSTLPLP